MKKFFLWCSGTDEQTLKIVQERDRKSINYQVMYGAMVLVPTVMAFVGMLHVASNFTNNKFIWVISGLVFSSMIFVFDRFIVLTFNKGNKKMFLARVGLSIPLGFVIALFGVFLIFNARIDEQISDYTYDKGIKIDRIYDGQKNIINERLNSLNDRRVCLEQLLIAETAGDNIQLFCGSTSGTYGAGVSEKQIRNGITEINRQITIEGNNISARLESLEEIRNRKKNDNIIRKDPLIELIALIQIIKDDWSAIVFVFGIFSLLMALDLFPILAKGFTKATLYDNVFRSEETTNIDLKSFLEKTQSEIDNYNPPKINKEKNNEVSNNNYLYDRKKISYAIISGVILAFLILRFEITDVLNGFAVTLILSLPFNILTGLIANRLSTYLNNRNKNNE